MRSLACIVVLLFGVGLFAQREGDKKDIDGQVFEFNKSVWVHKALGSNFEPTEMFTAVHKDPKWDKWYQSGSPTLKKILDLGKNVVFLFNDQSGASHVYWVLEDEAKVQKLLTGGAAALLPGVAAAGGAAGSGAAGGGAAAGGAAGAGVTTGLAVGIGAAVVAGAVIVDNNSNDESSSSSSKR